MSPGQGFVAQIVMLLHEGLIPLSGLSGLHQFQAKAFPEWVDGAVRVRGVAAMKRAGIDPMLWPRNAGSYPGYVFTGAPLKLPAGQFGLGHGSGAHAPDAGGAALMLAALFAAGEAEAAGAEATPPLPTFSR